MKKKCLIFGVCLFAVSIIATVLMAIANRVGGFACPQAGGWATVVLFGLFIQFYPISFFVNSKQE